MLRCVALGLCCLAAASQAQDATTYVVAQLHPAASDESPGTADAPFKTIGKAAQVVKPGETVLIETGTYRESVVIAASGEDGKPITFATAPGAYVIVTGADLLADWRREEGAANVFSADWPHVFIGWNPTRTHPGDDYHLMVGRAEQVFIDRYPLLQVLERGQMARGTFFVDETGKRLYVWDRNNQDIPQAGLKVEAATRQVVWQSKGAYVTTRGIHFRYAASMAQHGGVIVQGDRSILEDCLIEQMNGCGLSLGGSDGVVRRCTIRDNGQMGFGATSQNLLFTECTVENNNTKCFNRGWEAGGCKIVLSRNAIVEKCIFRGNHGVGVWYDIGNEDGVVRNCLIDGNDDAGIFYEISYGLHAHDNVIVRNGFTTSFGAWGGNGGITLSSSPGGLIERNLLVGNKEGVQFREQGRTTPRIGQGDKSFAVWNHDSTIRNNVIAYNRDVQTAGWFDLTDESFWPRAMQTRVLEVMPGEQEMPLGGDLNALEKRPVRMSLEDLEFTMEGNLFAARPGQKLLQWGCTWRRFGDYSELAKVQDELKLETGSQVGEISFADWNWLDLRLPAGSPALAMGCYPQGDVPGVMLGTVGDM